VHAADALHLLDLRQADGGFAVRLCALQAHILAVALRVIALFLRHGVVGFGLRVLGLALGFRAGLVVRLEFGLRHLLLALGIRFADVPGVRLETAAGFPVGLGLGLDLVLPGLVGVLAHGRFGGHGAARDAAKGDREADQVLVHGSVLSCP
jgi:hypothetical protein